MSAGGWLGPVEIGAKEIYELGLQTKDAVQELGGKVDRVRDAVIDHDARLDDHETRIRAIEQRRAFSPAQLASLALAFLAFIAAVVGLFVQ